MSIKGLLFTLVFGLLFISPQAAATDDGVPEPFQRYDNGSTYRINYSDLDTILKMSVVDTGRSTREVSAPTQSKTGTRMKANVKRATNKEGNRFYFEMYKDDEEARQALLNIQKSLEALPSEAPLEYFSRNEQLAYWLNLYNFTLINQIVDEYPERKLKKMLTGRKSVLDKKLLNVAGVELSLNDIQHRILKHNYDQNPLVIYGLYQGIIGGPNVRKAAYTGANVQRLLANNASEFINSNRGTYSRDERIFRASSLYDRNRDFFPDFQEDLKQHLLAYLQGPERRKLETSSQIKPDIDDWTITDLYGTYPQIGGSFAQNNAALLDATRSVTTGEGGVAAAPSSVASAQLLARSSPTSYVSPELITELKELKRRQDATNLDKATVTVEELGEVSAGTSGDGARDQDDTGESRSDESGN